MQTCTVHLADLAQLLSKNALPPHPHKTTVHFGLVLKVHNAIVIIVQPSCWAAG